MTEIRAGLTTESRCRIGLRLEDALLEDHMRKQLSFFWRSLKHARKSKIANAAAARAYASQDTVDREKLIKFFKLWTPTKIEQNLVRVGSEFDGGYLLLDDFDGIEACFSPGVSVTIDFDEAIAAKGINCFLADASVAGLPDGANQSISFEKKFLGPVTQGNTISLEEWVASNAQQGGDLLLQMDIEGAEYATLLNTSEATLSRFRMIALELHSFDNVSDSKKLEEMTKVLEKLRSHFYIVHLHNNNSAHMLTLEGITFPSVFEMTLVRKDRCTPVSGDIPIPHPLDTPNVPKLSDVAMPKVWTL